MRDALPQVSFVGFTGTPIEKADANPRRSATTSASTTSLARSRDLGGHTNRAENVARVRWMDCWPLELITLSQVPCPG
jgi:hypothetical protein